MEKIIENEHLNYLFEQFVNNVIKKRTDFFKPLQVVVPSRKAEQWFKAQWLKNEDDVLMNVKFLTMDNAISTILQIPSYKRIAKKNDLKQFIIHILSTRQSDLQLPETIDHYIYKENGVDSIRLYDLAGTLSQLFMDYDSELIPFNKWEKWQSDLYWKCVKECEKHYMSTTRAILCNAKFENTTTEPLYFFGFNELSNLEQEIVDKYSEKNEVIFYNLKDCSEVNIDPSKVKVITAPSRLREIEALHSEICSLAKKDGVTYSDFLVLAPSISEYETAIARVFNQDGKNFPKVPYSISSRKSVNSDVYEGLNLLINIYNKGFYTRLDFYQLLNNRIIQQIRGISQENIQNFAQAIIAMNVYRNGDKMDDWNYARKRILMTKVTDVNEMDENLVKLDGKEVLPFASIGLDDDSIVKMVSMIDDLDNWLATLKQIEFIAEDDISHIHEQLDKWFKNENMETDRNYTRVVKSLNGYSHYGFEDGNIPLNTLLYELLDCSKSSGSFSLEMFSKGVNFTDFDEKSILSAKYIFMLDLSSNIFPEHQVKNEIDVRDSIDNTAEIQRAFKIQLCNASEKLFISYVRIDLKTAEEFYPSSCIIDYVKDQNIEKENISIDETRDWNQIYTDSEKNKKDYYNNLLNNKTISDDIFNPIDYQKEIFKRITTAQMADYLELPLKQKAEHLFKNNDNLEEKIREEYEPFSLDKLQEYALRKDIIGNILKTQQMDENYMNELVDKAELEHNIPVVDEFIGNSEFSKLYTESNEVVASLEGNYELISLPDLLMDNDSQQWVLSCKEEVLRSVENDCRKYIQLKKFESFEGAKPETVIGNMMKKPHVAFDLYIISLMDIAAQNNEVMYHVEMIRTADIPYEYDCDSQTAKEILNSIYDLMTDYTDNKALPLEKANEVECYDDLVDQLRNGFNGVWQYYEDRKMFDMDNQLGYDKSDFETQFDDTVQTMKNLILFLK